jgi:hypothetical protein
VEDGGVRINTNRSIHTGPGGGKGANQFSRGIISPTFPTRILNDPVDIQELKQQDTDDLSAEDFRRRLNQIRRRAAAALQTKAAPENLRQEPRYTLYEPQNAGEEGNQYCLHPDRNEFMLRPSMVFKVDKLIQHVTQHCCCIVNNLWAMKRCTTHTPSVHYLSRSLKVQ